MVDDFTKVFPTDGQGASFQTLPDGVYKGILGSAGMSEKIQEELLENMRLLEKEYGYYSGTDLKPSQKVSEKGLVGGED